MEARSRPSSVAWSPAAGPVRLGPLSSSVVGAASAVFSPGGTLRVAVVTAGGDLWLGDGDGSAKQLGAGFRAGAVALADPDGSVAVVAIDAEEGLRLCSAGADLPFAASLGVIDAVAACRVDRGGRGIAVVARVDDALWWCPAPGAADDSEPCPVVTDAWVSVGHEPINGRMR